jgi:hypothetical protein
MTNKRYKLSDEVALKLGLNITVDKRYRMSENLLVRYNELEVNRGIVDACNNVGVDITAAPMMWLKTKEESVRVSNPYYVPSEQLAKEVDFADVYKNILPVIVKKELLTSEASLFDRLVYTDCHVGLEPNKTGYSLYAGEWNETILTERLEVMVKWTIANQKSNTLYIHDLGDMVDGWNGETTRAGHKLPQNMDNQTMFDVAVKFKLRLLESLHPYFEKIVCVNIVNDNHGGSFAYIVNSAFKTCAENLYKNCEVINQRKFIDHYIVGKRCFILSHGKDELNMKFGLKPQIDAKQITKIKDYIDEYKLHDYKCEFSKGDSHQLLLDFTSSKSFEYQNFGAFSPPSDWVKTNFGNTKSSFTHFNYLENQKLINNYIF